MLVTQQVMLVLTQYGAVLPVRLPRAYTCFHFLPQHHPVPVCVEPCVGHFVQTSQLVQTYGSAC